MDIIATNRKAYHNYEITEKYEAGIVLAGMEVKSIRTRQVDLKDSYAIISREEAYVLNMYIKPYAHDGRREVSSTRTRKLLLKKREINKLMGKVQQKGLTLIPLKLYISDRSFVKLQIGLGRSKNVVDKRDTLKKKDLDREMEREIGQRG